MLEGEGRFLVDKKEYITKKYDIVIISPYTTHSFLESNMLNKLLIIQFNDNHIAKTPDDIKDMKIAKPHIKKEKGNSVHYKLKVFLDELIEENKKKEIADELASKIILERILLTIIRDVKWERASDGIKEGKIKRISKTIKYVNENYFNDIALKKAAKVANFSEYHFSRYFKDAIGITFRNYLENIRIEKVKRLLRNTDTSVTGFAFSTGFSSLNTLERVFQRKKGINPSGYRSKRKRV